MSHYMNCTVKKDTITVYKYTYYIDTFWWWFHIVINVFANHW